MNQEAAASISKEWGVILVAMRPEKLLSIFSGCTNQDDVHPSDKTILELKAESVAYLVSKNFGLDGLSCSNYVALHGVTAEQIPTTLERIRNTAVEIIIALEVEEEQSH